MILVRLLLFSLFLQFSIVVAYLSSYHEKAINMLKRARLGVAGHLSTTPKWENPAKCLFQLHNK